MSLGAKRTTPKEPTMRERLLAHGFNVMEPTGKGFVIGTDGPVEKKDDKAK